MQRSQHRLVQLRSASPHNPALTAVLHTYARCAAAMAGGPTHAETIAHEEATAEQPRAWIVVSSASWEWSVCDGTAASAAICSSNDPEAPVLNE